MPKRKQNECAASLWHSTTIQLKSARCACSEENGGHHIHTGHAALLIDTWCDPHGETFKKLRTGQHQVHACSSLNSFSMKPNLAGAHRYCSYMAVHCAVVQFNCSTSTGMQEHGLLFDFHLFHYSHSTGWQRCQWWQLCQFLFRQLCFFSGWNMLCELECM